MTISEPTSTIAPQARGEVSRFIRRHAKETAARVGFTWVGIPEAPSTYQQLRGAIAHSKTSGEPLPASNLYCDATIYEQPADNLAFRFWHDVSHVRLGLSFRLEDELELALWHLAQAECAGYLQGSPVYQLLRADLIGQVLLVALIGRFPFDQRTFVQTCQQTGLMEGLLAEIRRVS